MNKLFRTPVPIWLKAKYKEWGKKWKQKYEETGDSKKFKWRRYQRHGYDDLVEELATMTKFHCSFCDAYPMGRRLKCTVEHFRPKTRHPLLAYTWENLFLCCHNCQEKEDDFDRKLLKPDQSDYDFDRYFQINWSTGELEANAAAVKEDQERAKITIKLYRLNTNGKPEDRLEELNKFRNSQNPDIQKWSYRFFIERGIGA